MCRRTCVLDDCVCTCMRLKLLMYVHELLVRVRQLQCIHIAYSSSIRSHKMIFFFMLRLNWVICPFKSESTLFSVPSLLIKGSSESSLHLCLLHFFISFHPMTAFGQMFRETVSWKQSSDGNQNQFVRLCLTDSLLAARLNSGMGSGDWQGSWSHYAEVWDHIPTLAIPIQRPKVIHHEEFHFVP